MFSPFGSGIMMEKLKYGLFNHNPCNYAIHIDGNIMLRKSYGITNPGLSYRPRVYPRHRLFSEERCDKFAKDAFLYIEEMVAAIEAMFHPKRAHTKIIHFEPPRADLPEYGFFRKLDTFFKLHLVCESEWMIERDSWEDMVNVYNHRNKSYDLNIFVTNNKDMMMVTYNHIPRVDCSSTNTHLIEWGEDHLCVVKKDLPLSVAQQPIIKHQIHNFNYGYDSGLTVSDSCLWINPSWETFAIGCDYNKNHLGFSRIAFRIFGAICGTFMTQTMLSESMIRGILNLRGIDLALLNEQTEILPIVALLLVIGLRHKGIVKAMDGSDLVMLLEIKCWLKHMNRYMEYLETGVIYFDSTSKKCKNNMLKLTVCILRTMDFKGSIYKKSEVKKWCKSLDLREALSKLPNEANIDSVVTDHYSYKCKEVIYHI